jgi:hypothetical protein
MITQLIASSSNIHYIPITSTYVLVGGGGGAAYNISNGLGGEVISGAATIPDGSNSITIGAGGSGTITSPGGVGSSSYFMSFVANGSSRSSTVSINGETFSGIDGGSTGGSTIKGSGASSSVVGPVGCSDGSGSDAARCSLRGYTFGQKGGSGNNGVCIITIPTIFSSRISTSGAVVTTSGSNTIYRFNSSGSLVVT